MNTRLPDADGTHRLGQRAEATEAPAGRQREPYLAELAGTVRARSPRGIPLVGDLVTATGTVRTVEALDAGRIRVTLDTPVETEGVEIHVADPAQGLGMYRVPGAALPEHVDLFASATTDPVAGRVWEPLRYPGEVTVTREDLGQAPLDQVKREGGSPVRTYLLRHLDEAQIALGYAETALEDVKTDHDTRAGQVAMILEALGHLDDLEAAANRSDYSEGDPHR